MKSLWTIAKQYFICAAGVLKSMKKVMIKKFCFTSRTEDKWQNKLIEQQKLKNESFFVSATRDESQQKLNLKYIFLWFAVIVVSLSWPQNCSNQRRVIILMHSVRYLTVKILSFFYVMCFCSVYGSSGPVVTEKLVVVLLSLAFM